MNRKKTVITILLFNAISFGALPTSAVAHSGDLDSRGCHYDSSTLPPTHHCHRQPKAQAAEQKESLASRYATNWIMFGIFSGVAWLVLRGSSGK